MLVDEWCQWRKARGVTGYKYLVAKPKRGGKCREPRRHGEEVTSRRSAFTVPPIGVLCLEIIVHGIKSAFIAIARPMNHQSP
eukprot:COSAG02_NODE_2179_length_9586_cov_14.521395_10_plen_82_part_00